MASIFETNWDTCSRLLDTAVDAILGDTVLYAVNGTTFVPIKAFVITVQTGAEGFGELETVLGTRHRVKVSKEILVEPLRGHRLRHPKLGTGTFQPGNDAPDEDGRYWVFDVQRVD